MYAWDKLGRIEEEMDESKGRQGKRLERSRDDEWESECNQMNLWLYEYIFYKNIGLYQNKRSMVLLFRVTTKTIEKWPEKLIEVNKNCQTLGLNRVNSHTQGDIELFLTSCLTGAESSAELRAGYFLNFFFLINFYFYTERGEKFRLFALLRRVVFST